MTEQHLIALNRFLKDDTDRRPHTRNYWHKNGYSYATNGSILIRIKGEFGQPYLFGVYPEIDDFKFGQLEALSDSDGLIFEMTSKELELCGHCAPDIKENTKVNCPECGGFGDIECSDCGSSIDCDNCDGNGSIIAFATKNCPMCFGTNIHYRESVKIGSKPYAMRMIAFLLDNYSNVRFFPQVNPIKNAMGFTFDAGVGAIMCLRE